MRNLRVGSWRVRRYAIAGGLAVLGATVALWVALSPPSGAASAQTLPSATRCSAHTTVDTVDGPVCGFVSGKLTEWLGIPYAAPPVGRLRWQLPRPPTHWSTPLRALHYSKVCPQIGDQNETGPWPQSENCLYLNVIAPPHPSGARLPVLVWIHGGGFQGGATVLYPGGHLARAGNVVFVSMNYRLGVLGFLATPAFGAHAGDYGLEDQQAALRWVKHNIARFGGIRAT